MKVELLSFFSRLIFYSKKKISEFLINKISYRNSIDTQDAEEYGENDAEMTDDFGGASNIGSGGSYNIDDFDLLDSDSEDKLVIDAPLDDIN
jgi:hypothetical protein